jgi:hypothetical protein
VSPSDRLYGPQEVVGVLEIAERLGVARSAVSMWILRGWPKGDAAEPAKPPKVVGTVSGQAAYRWSDVLRWARATGRLK